MKTRLVLKTRKEMLAARKHINRTVTEEDVVFHGGTAYIDRRAGIEVFAILSREDRANIVNGVVPVRVPRSAILAYLKHWPVK